MLGYYGNVSAEVILNDFQNRYKRGFTLIQTFIHLSINQFKNVLTSKKANFIPHQRS